MTGQAVRVVHLHKRGGDLTAPEAGTFGVVATYELDDVNGPEPTFLAAELGDQPDPDREHDERAAGGA